MTEASKYKYRVFLACSAPDRAWGEWLHAKLEDYHSHKPLFDRPQSAEAAANTLGPIYCDCGPSADDMPPSERTLAALQSSQFLVVLCSPAAARSARINSEIRRFRRMGRAGRVVPVLVCGNPRGSGREYLPPELDFIVGKHRSLIGRRGYPVLIARLQGDAKMIIIQKVVAEILGHGDDDIARFVAATRWRRAIVSRIVGAGLLALAIVFDHGMVFARYELSHNERLLNQTLVQVTDLTRKAVALSSSISVPQGLALNMVDAAEGLFTDIAQLGQDRPSLRVQKALMRIEFSRIRRFLGSSKGESTEATEIPHVLNGFNAELPEDSRIDLSMAFGKLSDLLQSHDRPREQVADDEVTASIANAVATWSGNAERQHELSAIFIKFGDASIARGSLSRAMEDYDESLAIAERLANAEPRNKRWQQALMLSHLKMGDVLRLQGKLDEALESYSTSKAIASELASAASGQIAPQRGLAMAYFGIGEVLMLQNSPNEALVNYRASNAIAQRLAAADPASPQRQHDLGISHDRIGALLEARNDFAAALAEYRSSLDIAIWLETEDPHNGALQRNLGIAYGHIGDVLFAIGDFAGSLKAFEAKRAVIGRLVAASSRNPIWQNDLGATHARIGFLLEMRNALPEAEREYEACLAIAKRLAMAEPDNAQTRLNVAVSYRKLAEIHHLLGNSKQALLELRQGRAIVIALRESAPELQLGTNGVEVFDNRITALEGRTSASSSGANATAIDWTPPPTLASAVEPGRIEAETEGN